MRWWSWLFMPFTLIYDLITRARNALYDSGTWPSIQFETNVISVGNLSVGGTGKSPMVEYLIRLLSGEENHITTLSRGYGRKTYGFRIAGKTDDAQTIGDEPYSFHKKYGSSIAVAVGNSRDLAIPEILYHRPDTNIILMDDAFQHRVVGSSLSILLTDFNQLFYKDYILPSGRLREARSGAKRADLIVVTKCPKLTEIEQEVIKTNILHYSQAPVFFATIDYGHPLPIFDEQPPLSNNVVAICGIAKPKLFQDYLESQFSVKLTHAYRDHHRYTKLDVKHIMNELDDKTSLICTEKDAVKLEKFEELKQYAVFYVPIRTQFLKDEALFQSIVRNSLKSFEIL